MLVALGRAAGACAPIGFAKLMLLPHPIDSPSCMQMVLRLSASPDESIIRKLGSPAQVQVLVLRLPTVCFSFQAVLQSQRAGEKRRVISLDLQGACVSVCV